MLGPHWYVRRTTRARVKNGYAACYPEKTSAYILRVVPIITHTHVRHKSIGEEKKEKDRKEKKKKAKVKRKGIKKRKRKDGKGKKIHESESRKGKARKQTKNTILELSIAIRGGGGYCLSFELRCHYRFQGRGRKICLPFGQIHPSQPPDISYVSRPHIYRLSP